MQPKEPVVQEQAAWALHLEQAALAAYLVAAAVLPERRDAGRQASGAFQAAYLDALAVVGRP